MYPLLPEAYLRTPNLKPERLTISNANIINGVFFDIANKAQVNMYATGLHEVGSSAVEHYSMLELHDLFVLLCAAFNQPQYRVDKQLNVLPEEAPDI